MFVDQLDYDSSLSTKTTSGGILFGIFQTFMAVGCNDMIATAHDVGVLSKIRS